MKRFLGARGYQDRIFLQGRGHPRDVHVDVFDPAEKSLCPVYPRYGHSEGKDPVFRGRWFSPTVACFSLANLPHGFNIWYAHWEMSE